jgi:DNA-binding response OmpR family regulator
MGEPTVVVVDDDDLARRTLTTLLERRGWRVRAFGDADSAMAAIEHEAVEAVIVDRWLGAVDGLALGRALRAKNHRTLRLVLLTGDTEATDPAFDAVLIKPATARDVLHAIEPS